MEITDEEKAQHYLSHIGYYRVSAYMYPLWRKRSIPTHSEWLYPLTFDAGKGLKEA